MAQQQNQQELPIAAPLPVMAGTSASSAAANPWQHSALRLPINCQKKRLKRTHNVKTGRVVPSRFRQGEMLVDAEGVHFAGVGGQPIIWLNRLSIIGGGVVLVVSLYLFYYLASYLMPGTIVLAILCGILFFLVVRKINDYRTAPMDFLVPWEAVVQIQVKSQKHPIHFLYESHRQVSQKGERTLYGHLSITFASPSDTGSFVDFAETFIGERVQRKDRK